MNNCKHQYTQEYWVPDYEDDWGTNVQGHWEYTTESACRDLSTGSYQCTICNAVMYYTGKWKEYHEG